MFLQIYFFFLTPKQYYDALSGLCFDFEIWVSEYFQRIESAEELINRYSGNGLKPYLDALEDKNKELFKAELLKEI